MTSRKERNRELFAVFGTPFEELDESEGASKKPLSVENQIVTDEKGRRRFHGAFTGGFSAGYFNTVGTKEGWIPSTFKSTRSKREDVEARRAEDFMDSEDFSEYGIAPRQIRTTQAFSEAVADQPVESQKRRFAGETSNDIQEIADRLSDLVRPVSDSIGVKLMRSMGWRPGKGVGATQIAFLRERSKAVTKVYGCELPQESSENAEEIAVMELESMAPGFQFAPSDVEFVKFEPKTNLHGLGYKGLDVQQHLRSAKALEKESALRIGSRQKKGIRGQAFGVGAFEDDDDDLFATDDFSNYDFTLGGSGATEKQNASTSDFAPASKPQAPRNFFPPPKLSRDYVPAVPSTSGDKSTPGRGDKRETTTKIEDQSKNSLQRANALGGSHSVWSLVSVEDRQRIENIKASRSSRFDVKKEEPKEEKKPSERTVVLDMSLQFPDDPKKKARFQDFVNYLKRGLCPPQPPDLTEWDWDREQIEFRKLLPSDLVQAGEDARMRQKPLAGSKIATALSSGFKSKFTKGAFAEDEEAGGKNQEDEDKVKAVQMKMFGAMTREKHEWHPDKTLCKRFNVPNPYPESRVVGVPHFKKDPKAGLFPLDFDVITTATDQTSSEPGPSDSGSSRRPTDSPITKTHEDQHQPSQFDSQEAADPCPAPEEDTKPPMSLFKAVFAESSSSSESDDEPQIESIEPPVEPEPPIRALPFMVGTASGAPTDKQDNLGTRDKPIEVEDATEHLLESFPKSEMDLYGPALPPESSEISLPATSVVRRHKRQKKSKSHRRHRHRKDSSDKKKSSKKRHRHKEKKSKSKRQSDSESESSSESSD